MNDLPGNPWIEYGIHNMQMAGAANNNGDHTRAQMLSIEASTNATLALAYEQRTATLVQALLSDSLVTDGKYDEIQAEVRKRLGLEAQSE